MPRMLLTPSAGRQLLTTETTKDADLFSAVADVADERHYWH
jgi:hypothetical protein